MQLEVGGYDWGFGFTYLLGGKRTFQFALEYSEFCCDCLSSFCLRDSMAFNCFSDWI